MDGIAGIISPFKQLVRQERLKQMVPVADTQESEKESRWIDPQETTGFAVEGTHTAIQHYRHYTLLLNGRIYNSRPLKNRLQQEGYLFPTGNDCELIGAAYDLWKEKCMEKLDGKFAFALHDGQTGDLLLVRDRFGEKPLYYYGDFRERGRFVQFLFASQMKALWKAGAPKQLDGTMVLNYLTLGYVQNPNKKMATFYSDILSLPPGHYLKIMPQAGRVQMRRWYRLDWHINTDRTVEDAVVRFRELFLQSVTQRAEGWPVIGCKEDAGITASAIRAVLPPIAGRKVFSIIPPSDNTGNRYLSGQQQVAYRPEKSEPVEDFYRLCDGQEQPFADIRILKQYRFFRWAAAQGIPVLLDPLGGLEILGGHPSYIACFLQGLIRKDYNTFKKKNPYSCNTDSWGNGTSGIISPALRLKKQLKSSRNGPPKNKTTFRGLTTISCCATRIPIRSGNRKYIAPKT